MATSTTPYLFLLDVSNDTLATHVIVVPSPTTKTMIGAGASLKNFPMNVDVFDVLKQVDGNHYILYR